jgi:hypothetical protein
LKNDGSTQTNRVGRVCIQIEVIAYSDRPFTAYWKPGKNFKALVAALKSWGIPVDVWPAGPPPRFIASPPHNVPENDRDRKTWLTKGGYFSHSQIPANDHGDPGGIDVDKFAAAGKATVPAKPPVTPPSTKDIIDMATQAEVARAVSDGIRMYMKDFFTDEQGTGDSLADAAAERGQAQVAKLDELITAVNKLTAALTPKA